MRNMSVDVIFSRYQKNIRFEGEDNWDLKFHDYESLLKHIERRTSSRRSVSGRY